MEDVKTKVMLKPQEYKSDQEIRWCPGCGDHAIFNSVIRAFSELGLPKEKIAVISGIGCSSRFPYYTEVYGFHTIHGRAGAIASGFKTANPEMSVWQITGDGDGLAIGGNHFIHEIRRNIDLNVVLFNNRIYGLTKGQYSPTTPHGKVTKTSPYGTIEDPFIVGQLVIGSLGNFFARSIDAKVKETTNILVQAEHHKGASVVEILQNCVIYFDGAHQAITDKATEKDNQLWIEHGKPMIFGKENNKGIIMREGRLEVAVIGENGITEKDILVHDAHTPDPYVHLQLVRMTLPEFPVVFGVIREVKMPTYERLLEQQIEEVKALKPKMKTMQDVLNSGNTWETK